MMFGVRLTCESVARGEVVVAEIKVVREWDAEAFHAKVLDLERQGWHAKRDTYKITAEMSPDDGNVIHLHTIELVRERQS